MIKAITFDLWNTILNYRVDYRESRIALLSAALKKSGFDLDAHKIASAYESAVNLVNITWQNQHRNIAVAKLIEFILESLDAPLADDVRQELGHGFEHAILTEPPPLLENTKQLLQSLRDRYHLGLICDTGMTPGKILRKVLELHDILNLFSCHVFSDEVGVTKPHPLIFRTALDRLGVNAMDTMHVGDLLTTDIVGAKAVGMKAVWLNHQSQQMNKILPKFAPDYEIRSLSEILKILE